MLNFSQSSRWAALLALLALSACANIPKRRYGIDSLRFKGMKDLDAETLRACISTEQREKVTLGLGALVSPDCGVAPFDRSRWSARLFALPWTDWPTYDEAVLKLDLDRIERWYHARGYYGVRVLDVGLSRDGARVSDACNEKNCKLDITIKIDEGEPVRIRKLEVEVVAELTPELKEDILDALELKKGDIFDEALYDIAREELADVLREEGYARVAVEGDIVINRGLLVADIKLRVTPGPLCHIGEVTFKAKGDVPTGPVRAVTFMKKGDVYRESSLADAQRAIYALGAFSAVTVRGELATQGPEIPVTVELETRREKQIMVGGGITSGLLSSGSAARENLSVPQWDVHLIGSYENRNFFGGLRRFRIEERPRMLFLDQFPKVPDNSPRFGNTISAEFSQPGVIDARTNLFLEANWDNGPDPFLLFFRNDVGVALGLERSFFKQRLNARVAIHQDIMEVSRRQPVQDDIRGQLEDKWEPRINEAYEAEVSRRVAAGLDPLSPASEADIVPITVDEEQAEFFTTPSSYRLPFLEQQVTVDLRDDAARPRKGGLLRITAHEALGFWEPSWNYLRLTPEARGYVPLGLGIVLAGRFAMGWLKVFSASSKLDEQSRILGAQSYRLRGGGANSVRGFTAGDLGDGRTGGTHRWEASLELRVPLSENFFIVGFTDMGDVNAGLAVDRTYAARVTEKTSEEYAADLKEWEDNDREGAEPSMIKPKLPGDLRPTIRRRNAGFRWNYLNTTVGLGLRYYTVIGPVRLDVGYRPKVLAGAEADDPEVVRQDRDTRMFKGFRGAVHLTIGDSF